jgi:hypothetical protein
MMDQVLIDANGLDTLSLSRQERYSFRNHSESDNNARTVQVRIRLSKSSDNAVSAPFRWAEVNEENLIVIVVDDGAQSLTATHQIGGRELALKHGKLKMVSKPAHQLEDLPQSLVVRDVVTDQVRTPHICLLLFVRRKEAEPIETASTKAYRPRNIQGLVFCVTPLNLDMKARKPLQMVRDSVSVGQIRPGPKSCLSPFKMCVVGQLLR